MHNGWLKGGCGKGVRESTFFFSLTIVIHVLHFITLLKAPFPTCQLNFLKEKKKKKSSPPPTPFFNLYCHWQFYRGMSSFMNLKSNHLFICFEILCTLQNLFMWGLSSRAAGRHWWAILDWILVLSNGSNDLISGTHWRLFTAVMMIGCAGALRCQSVWGEWDRHIDGRSGILAMYTQEEKKRTASNFVQIINVFGQFIWVACIHNKKRQSSWRQGPETS